MGFAILRGFDVQDTASAIRSLLPGWRSSGRSAASRRDSLFRLLRKQLPGYPLKKSVPAEGIAAVADILVAHHLAVLLESGLTSAAKLEKIKKRLGSFRGWEGVILLILTGKVDDAFRSRLDDFVNGANNDREFMSAREIIVTRA